MKNSLILLTFVLLVNPLFSQIFLPPSLNNASQLWPQKVQETIQNYQQHSAVAELQDDQTRESELILDSTITYHEQFIDDIIFATPLWRTDHYCLLFDVEQIIESVYDNQTWMFQFQNRIRRDEQGRLISLFSEIYDPSIQTWIPESRLAAFPHGSSDILLDSMYIDGWSEETYSWNRLLTLHNNFDQQDRLIESTSVLDLTEVFLVLKDLYHYNEHGLNHLIESFLVDGEEEIPAGIQEMDYFNGLLSLRTNSAADGLGGFVPESQESFVYTPFDQIGTFRNFIWDFENNSWELQQSDQYTYDQEERLIEQETNNYYEDLGDERLLVRYTYETADYLETEAHFIFDFESEIFVQDNKKYYYYNGVVSVPTIPLVEESLKLWPNPSRDYVEIELEAAAFLQVFNQNGQLVRSQFRAAGREPLPIIDLPAGIYYLKARTESGLFSSRFVKQ